MVVRPNGKDGRYLIVDGEHGWRAATKAGFQAIPCEIIEADDFEAMRQTYKRNQHGTHAPILLGKFFKRMMEEKGLSQRAPGPRNRRFGRVDTKRVPVPPSVFRA